MKFQHLLIPLSIFLASCAGWSRDCQSCNTESFGANWLVVQYSNNGRPINCWKLNNTSISNEDKSDGIYWKDPHNSNLVHISGWYNRVQVENNDWESAATSLGISLKSCQDGAYTAPVSSANPFTGLLQPNTDTKLTIIK